jgi:hypothetical protein
MIKIRSIVSAGLASLALMPCPHADAAIIQVQASGTVTYKTAISENDFVVGDPFAWTFTYDSGSAGIDTWYVVDYPDSLLSSQVTVGGNGNLHVVANFTGTGHAGDYYGAGFDAPSANQIDMWELPSADRLFVNVFNPDGPAVSIGGQPYYPTRIGLSLGGPPSLWSLNDLASFSMPELSRFAIDRSFAFWFAKPGDYVGGAAMGGTITSLSAQLVQVVPTPAAAWLFGSALGLLGSVRFRTEYQTTDVRILQP